MADAERRADAVWEGTLATGSGKISLATGLATDLPVTWASRTGPSEGKTSPEELLAAAHASCFCMALSNTLDENETPPDRLEASATVTFSQVEGGWKVASSRITVKGTVPGITSDAFREAAEAAKDGCPISGALKGNVELSVQAELA
jgi:lipoyl-dependent peroxiredoxin